jgi:hypothetical protein
MNHATLRNFDSQNDGFWNLNPQRNECTLAAIEKGE